MDRGWTYNHGYEATASRPWRRLSRVHESARTIKQRCQPGEFYCLGCRAPKQPALDMADYHPHAALRGSLSGICPACGRMIYRGTTLAKLDEIKGGLNVAFPRAEQRLDDSASALPNADFRKVQDT